MNVSIANINEHVEILFFFFFFPFVPNDLPNKGVSRFPRMWSVCRLRLSALFHRENTCNIGG